MPEDQGLPIAHADCGSVLWQHGVCPLAGCVKLVLRDRAEFGVQGSGVSIQFGELGPPVDLLHQRRGGEPKRVPQDPVDLRKPRPLTRAYPKVL